MTAHLKATVRGLLRATDLLIEDALDAGQREEICARGSFRPGQDEAIGYWFARFLTIRDGLWGVLDDVRAAIHEPMKDVQDVPSWRVFMFGYAAACALVRIDRFLLFEFATHSTIQRKLNEPFPEYRVGRKQFRKIFSAYVYLEDALLLYDAWRFAGRNRGQILALRDDEQVGFLVRRIDVLESWLDTSKRSYLKGVWRYLSHKWRRRGVAGAQKVFAQAMEGVGRAASEIGSHSHKRVTAPIRAELAALLRPGDVIMTRHDLVLTNLFLPGFWPHAALHIGTPEQRDALGVALDAERRRRWSADVRVLEARKDGVLFRPLDDTLAVDCCVVLRPRLSADGVRRAIERAVAHEGKLYNFDFDFFNSDALVCTEVVYRALDGLESIDIPLVERAMRQTLSAEDLLDYALESDQLEPVAIFGVAGCEQGVVSDASVARLLRNSYRPA